MDVCDARVLPLPEAVIRSSAHPLLAEHQREERARASAPREVVAWPGNNEKICMDWGLNPGVRTHQKSPLVAQARLELLSLTPWTARAR